MFKVIVDGDMKVCSTVVEPEKVYKLLHDIVNINLLIVDINKEISSLVCMCDICDVEKDSL